MKTIVNALTTVLSRCHTEIINLLSDHDGIQSAEFSCSCWTQHSEIRNYVIAEGVCYIFLDNLLT